MRTGVALRIIGSFLQIFALLVFTPFLVGIYYGETAYQLSGFIWASALSFFLGYMLHRIGDKDRPTVLEAMFSTVLGWILAIFIGSIPFMIELSMVDAVFESAAGLTTTGISVVMHPEDLSNSLLFWRSFSQWIGGLGILTFFVAVIRESGGVTRRLYSAEAHKTDSGSIRPSLTKSVTELWRVYGFITSVFVAIYIVLGMPAFDALLHSFSGISTGGFSTMSESIAAFNSDAITIATIFLMFLGGANFVLLYRLFRSDYKPLLQSSEFKLYSKIAVVLSIFMSLELFRSGFSRNQAVLDGAFQATAVLSSTGYSTLTLTSFSVALQTVIIGVMLIGGSLGSTSGGIKIFRLKTMLELSKTRLKSYKLPNSAINKVKIDGEILGNHVVKTIAVIFFVWISMVAVSTVLVLAFDDVTLMAALSGSVSAAGNMGPVYMADAEITQLSAFSKINWSIMMLAGRLEMLPLLAIFNSELFKETK